MLNSTIKIKPVFFYLLIIVGMFFWGMSFIWVKIMYKYYGPFTVITLRMALSVLLMFFIDLIFRQNEKIALKDIKYFALVAFFEPFMYFVFEGFGIKLVSSTVAAVIVGTIPLFSPVFAFLLYKEKLSIYGFIGMIISFAGVCIMVLDRNMNFIYSKAGIALMFGAVFSTVFYVLVIKKIGVRYKPLTIIKYQNLIGLIYFIPFFAVIELKQSLTVAFNFEMITTLLLLAVFPSTLSFIAFNISINRIGIGKSNLFTNLIPVFSAVFSFLLLGEQFDLKKIISIIIIISGVSLAQINFKKKATILSEKINMTANK